MLFTKENIIFYALRVFTREEMREHHMIDGKKLIKDQDKCFDCGCNLKPVCQDYKEDKMKVNIQRLCFIVFRRIKSRAHDLLDLTARRSFRLG